MCLKGKSKFCLVCILLYTFLPSTVEELANDETQHPSPTNDLDSHHGDHNYDYQVAAVATDTVYEIKKDFYVNALMDKYGNGENMTFEGFEHLLKNLGLGGVLVFDHSIGCHKQENKSMFKDLHNNHEHLDASQGSACNETLTDHDHDGEEADVHGANPEHDNSFEHFNDDGDDHHNNVHDETDNKNLGESLTKSITKRELDYKNMCMPARVMFSLVDSIHSETLTKSMFRDLCPSLIYQIDADTCHSHHTDQNQHGDHVHHTQPAQNTVLDIGSIPAKVWGFSAVAVLIISLVGLLGVAVIPIMQKVFYNHFLQFLVALAVGALSGDALLHLLPHAMSGGHAHSEEGTSSNHDDHGHQSETGGHDLGPVIKGLCGLAGIYFFFVVERLLTIFTEKKRRKKTLKNRDKYMNGMDLEKVGEKLSGKENECDEMIMTIHPNRALQAYADETHKEHCFENSSALLHEHRSHPPNHNSVDEENTSMLKVEASKGHGHGHSHGVDGIPNSVASVAWMVILGDGIHNFSDGLAIGAAFANSITGGFSTSIAVFCHELPHEIGDFAMLLRAGMAPKRALFYNCLSSILCFLGMLIGVAIGNVQDASLWIFAIVGGMFLYIALVDMLPELSAVETKEGENSHCHLLIQCVGMLMGGGIMLIIALYEEQLRTLLE